MTVLESVADARIVPVIIIKDAEHAVPLARALIAGGLNVLEITLRTACALDAMRRISAEIPEALVGAGTVVDAKQVEQARAAGAKFLVSPGFLPQIATAARDADMTLLPGIATPTEIMTGLANGIQTFKFFPAELVGGVNMLRALSSPFPGVKFCPTGGINAANLPDYMSLPNVFAVGGSWMIPADFMQGDNLAKVTKLAREAVQLSAAYAKSFP